VNYDRVKSNVRSRKSDNSNLRFVFYWHFDLKIAACLELLTSLHQL
jgi:hypothetical protein